VLVAAGAWSRPQQPKARWEHGAALVCRQRLPKSGSALAEPRCQSLDCQCPWPGCDKPCACYKPTKCCCCSQRAPRPVCIEFFLVYEQRVQFFFFTGESNFCGHKRDILIPQLNRYDYSSALHMHKKDASFQPNSAFCPAQNPCLLLTEIRLLIY